VIELLGAYPGRDFKMIEILKYAGYRQQSDSKKRSAMRIAIHRVLKQLEEAGSIEVQRNARTAVLYRWKTIT
jgi:ribosomal protein S19E (S16A)